LYPDNVCVVHTFYENKFPIPTTSLNNFDLNNIKNYAYKKELHFGHVTFKKTIFETYLYSDKPRGQDIEIMEKLLPGHISNIKIYDEPLTYYISERSSFYKN
jgi:hypothetical protein